MKISSMCSLSVSYAARPASMAAMAMTCLVGVMPALAQAGPITLAAGSGDGFVSFTVDEYGTSCATCGGSGMLFDPLGPAYGARETLARSTLYVFDPDRQWRQALNHRSIPAQWCEAVPGIDPGDLMMDTVVDGHKRITAFTLTAHPTITVHLEQTALGAMLIQRYTFTNRGAAPEELLLTRVADIDLMYGSEFWHNTGAFVPPAGAAVIDYTGAQTVIVDVDGSAAFDGWRLFQRYGGWGASEHFKVWSSYGFGAASLNGIFANQHGILCTEDEARIAAPFLSDTTATLQSRLSLMPGESGTFITRTRFVPGVDDTDGDGVPDADDDVPTSNTDPTVIIHGCDTGVPNLVLDSGATFLDLIAACEQGSSTHGDFVSCVAALANDWLRAGLISGAQKGAIMRCT